mgnify:CR=1 FL=1
MGIFNDDFVNKLIALPVSARAAKARDALLQHGSVSTEQLSDMGYNHPPRAIADLKEAGVLVATSSTTSRTGKRIALYTLVPEITEGRKSRVALPKKFREELNKAYGNRCAICSGKYENRELQADHRIPFWIAGDADNQRQEDFMPLCASDNRSKSWSCEQCDNFVSKKIEVCKGCFWAHPESYSHVAGMQERRITITAQGKEAEALAILESEAAKSGTTGTRYALEILVEMAKKLKG